ncbi:MAG: hypothetical protein K2X54_04945 [Methylobacterium organophilum]|nr:hypothetical protein [Methylobacterium organophilum]
MTDDDGRDGGGSQVEAANGSFYQAYKRQLSELIYSIEAAGSEALKNPSLQARDRWELENGLNILKDSKKNLLGLLSSIIDEKNPSFFEECTIENITNVLSGVFMTSKYLLLTDSAVQETLKKQANIARAARQPKLSKEKAARIELVKRHCVAAGVDFRNPYKAAEVIRDAVNAERAKAGKPGVTVRSIQNWINEAELATNSENS